LFNNGVLPEIVVIEYASENEDPFELERGWVSYFREIGCRLTNETDGGEGRTGYKASDETKQKLKERVHSKEWRENLSRAQRERFKGGMPSETKAKISAKSRKPRPDLSKILKGRKFTEEWKENISKARKAYWARRKGNDPNQGGP
jgi:hypothetical protein